MSQYTMDAGKTAKIRVDHVKFYQTGSAFYANKVNTEGVFDNDSFVDCAPGTTILRYFGSASKWDSASSIGTEHNLFVEDCFFYSWIRTGWTPARHNMTGVNGADYVYRYNSSRDSVIDWSEVDMHGICENPISIPASGRNYEIYSNTTYNKAQYTLFSFIRGGTGYIYNNAFTYPGATGSRIQFTNYMSFRGDSTAEGKAQSTPVGAGCAAYLTDTITSCHYECCDYPCPGQVLNSYVWGNTLNGSPNAPSIDQTGIVEEHIQIGRDVFETEAVYTPYTYPHPYRDGDPLPQKRRARNLFVIVNSASDTAGSYISVICSTKAFKSNHYLYRGADSTTTPTLMDSIKGALPGQMDTVAYEYLPGKNFLLIRSGTAK
jgi:hypothetical protein